MKKRIEEYALEFNPGTGPGYCLKLQNHRNWTGWYRVTVSDFTAIALILKEEVCYYDEETLSVTSFSKDDPFKQEQSFYPPRENDDNLNIIPAIREVDDILNERTPNIGDDASADRDAFELDKNFAHPTDSPPLLAASIPWRVAKCLEVLRNQINKSAPFRNKLSDGTIGDRDHRKRTSDHNPWVLDKGVGVVTALDITHDPDNGCDANEIANSIRASRDRRVKYIIWNRQIASASPIKHHPAWTWRPYAGSNPHKHHIHISIKAEKLNYDDTAVWDVLVQAPIS